jgi:hypothetical protein
LPELRTEDFHTSSLTQAALCVKYLIPPSGFLRADGYSFTYSSW